jgi:16S rRNA (cytosine967-C5)-methyltransferase
MKRRMKAREAALRLLARARRGREFMDDILESTPLALDGRERAFLTRLLFGVLRHRRTLNYLIEKYAGRSADKVHPEVLILLQTAAYQMLFMERVPDYAACDEAVRLAKSVSPRSSRFVNAVLRALLRDVDRKGVRVKAGNLADLETEDGRGVRFKTPWLRSADPVDQIGLRYSYPNVLVSRWLKTHDRDVVAGICRHGNHPLPVTARVNLRKVTREALIDHLKQEGIRARKGSLPSSVFLEDAGDVGKLESFRKGEFTVQDDTSIRIGLETKIQNGHWALDLAASPGGKATHLAELAPSALVVANDLTTEKARRIADHRERLGAAGLHVMVADGTRVAFRRAFDVVVVDAPCSNTAVLSRRPEARWRFGGRSLGPLTGLQKRLLTNGIRSLKRGGTLVYSTCSLEPEENEEVVQHGVREFPHLRLDDSRLFLPGPDSGGGFFARLVWPGD